MLRRGRASDRWYSVPRLYRELGIPRAELCLSFGQSGFTCLQAQFQPCEFRFYLQYHGDVRRIMGDAYARCKVPGVGGN